MGRRHQSTHKIVCWRFTRRCNRECPFCLSLSGPRHSDPIRDVVAVVDRLAELGVEKISYSGGEPLLAANLEAAVRRAEHRDIEQILTTNGDLLAVKRPTYLQALRYIKLSFYGARATHDHVMGEGHYDKLLRVAARETEAALIVGANFMLSRASVADLRRFLGDAADAKIDNVLLLGYIPTGRADIDSEYACGPVGNLLDLIRSQVAGIGTRFRGGIKVHDYGVKDFFIVLNELDQLTLPRDSGNGPHILGSVFEEFLRLPNDEVAEARKALNRIWHTRLVSEAVIPV